MNIITMFRGVPLDPNYNDTISYPDGNKTSQLQYFTDYYAHEIIQNVSWTIPFKNIRINKTYNQTLPFNYIQFKNDDGKNYYAFIVEKRYINVNTTELIIEIDYIQSYYFDYKLGDTFIEREHQDRFKSVLVDGKLERIFNSKSESVDYGSDYGSEMYASIWGDIPIQFFAVISETPLHPEQQLSRWGHAPSTHYVTLVPHPINLFTIDFSLGGGTPTDAFTLTDFYSKYKDDNSILAVYPLPFIPIKLDVNYGETTNNWRVLGFEDNLGNAKIRVVDGKAFITIEPDGDDRYKPINVSDGNISNAFDSNFYRPTFNKDSDKSIFRESKLYTYPYNFITISDGQTNPLIIKNENVRPKNFNNISYIQELGMSGKYGLLFTSSNVNVLENYFINNQDRAMPLITDAWKDYVNSGRASSITGLAVNGVSTVLGGAGAVAAGLAMTNPISAAVAGGIVVGGMISVAGNVANQIAKEHDIKAIPDNFKNAGNNSLFELAKIDYDITYSGSVHAYSTSIRDVYRQQLYQYFSVYGYKTNEIKTPNLYSRLRFNYIKTVGARLTPNGDIDADATVKIATILDKGITLHHQRLSHDIEPFTNYEKENIEMILI